MRKKERTFSISELTENIAKSGDRKDISLLQM